jgi:hypothetical protein
LKNIIRIENVLFFLAFYCNVLFGQCSYEEKFDPNEVVLHSLENAIQSKYGNYYEVWFHILDSLISNSPPNEISDPYGTLAGCVLFSAWHTWSDDSVVDGIYKNGQIIWDDYPGAKGGIGSELLIAKDINGDGEVDIIGAERNDELTTREGSGITYLWILSWNGIRGRIINDINPVTGQSMLITTDNYFKLINSKQIGVFSIRCVIDNIWQRDFPDYHPKSLPYINYKWNGTKYGHWIDVKK